MGASSCASRNGIAREHRQLPSCGMLSSALAGVKRLWQEGSIAGKHGCHAWRMDCLASGMISTPGADHLAPIARAKNASSRWGHTLVPTSLLAKWRREGPASEFDDCFSDLDMGKRRSNDIYFAF